jgi:O-antigen/teichoic acid export membrane protein
MGEARTTRGKKRDEAIVRGVVASVTARTVNAIMAILTLGVAAKALTTEEFGLVAALFSLWMILTLLDLGVAGALVTRVASSHGRGDLDELRSSVREAFVALTVIGLLIAAGGAGSVLLLPWEEWIGGSTLAATTVRTSVVLVFVMAGAALPAAVGLMTMTGQQRLASAQVVMALRGVFTLIATASAAYAGLGPWAFILAMVGAPTLISSALTAWIMVRELGRGTERVRFVARRITSTIRDSAYFAVSSIGNAVAFGTGTLIVAAVLGPGEAGVFSVASRMFVLVGTMINGAGAQLWPAMTEAITRGDVGWARSRYRRGMAVVGLVTSTVCLGLVVLGQPLARIWVGSALVPPFDLLVWTAAFTVAVAVASQASVLLRAVDRLRALAALSVAAAVVSVTASVWLTQAMGMSGAAVGALAACLGLFLPGVAVLVRRALRDLEDD